MQTEVPDHMGIRNAKVHHVYVASREYMFRHLGADARYWHQVGSGLPKPGDLVSERAEDLNGCIKRTSGGCFAYDRCYRRYPPLFSGVIKIPANGNGASDGGFE